MKFIWSSKIRKCSQISFGEISVQRNLFYGKEKHERIRKLTFWGNCGLHNSLCGIEKFTGVHKINFVRNLWAMKFIWSSEICECSQIIFGGISGQRNPFMWNKKIHKCSQINLVRIFKQRNSFCEIENFQTINPKPGNFPDSKIQFMVRWIL